MSLEQIETYSLFLRRASESDQPYTILKHLILVSVVDDCTLIELTLKAKSNTNILRKSILN